MTRPPRPDFITLKDSKDHYVPKFMLRRWLQPSKEAMKLPTFRWKEERHTDGTLLRTFRVEKMLGLMEVACHPNLNKVGWRSKDEDLETRFATPIDTAAAVALKGLVEGDEVNPTLSKDALDALVRFVVFLQIRSPYVMEDAEEEFLSLWRGPLDARTREMAKQTGKLGLALLDSAVSHLRAKSPTIEIRRLPADLLFTSDRPVYRATDSRLTFVALSPRICLAIIMPGAEKEYGRLLANGTLPHMCNAHQLMWAKVAIAPNTRFPASYPWDFLGEGLPIERRKRSLIAPCEAPMPEMSAADEAHEFLRSVRASRSSP